ncbi:MAG: NUDIX hydrolase [Proteobacteria bacterium]|nr:NUDIX hydrolase [Pseudomonadota bacterium]
MIKLGIDVHGVADTAPHFFSELSRILVENGHEVHILTGAEHTDALEYELKHVLKLSWTHFFSTTSYHKNTGTEITYIDGNPYMDNKIWNRSKSEYCRRHGIQLHIDDSDVYGKYFKTPYAQFGFSKSDEQKSDETDGATIEEAINHEPSVSSPARTPDPSAMMGQRPSVRVDIAICTIINASLKVLLVKRKETPFKNHWALPGGFIDIQLHESLDKAASRELTEKTGLESLYIEQLKTYGDVNRDPRDRVISTAYFSLVPYTMIENQRIRFKPETKEARWFSLKNHQIELMRAKEALAFDHNLMLNDLLRRIQGKISYTPIAFELVSSTFTWSDLRTVYEAVLDKKIDPANFKKKIKSLYSIKELKTRKNINAAGRPPAFIAFEGVKDQYI